MIKPQSSPHRPTRSGLKLLPDRSSVIQLPLIVPKAASVSRPTTSANASTSPSKCEGSLPAPENTNLRGSITVCLTHA